MWPVIVSALLVLNPVLDDDATLRLASSGTGDAAVTWSHDGDAVATTQDAQAAHIELAAGEHRLQARSDHDGAWRILARPADAHGPGAAYVDGWTARHDPDAADPLRSTRDDAAPEWPMWLPAAVGIGLVLWPRRRPGQPEA